MFRKNALTYNVTLSFNQGTLKKLGLKVGGGGGGGVKGRFGKLSVSLEKSWLSLH